MIAAVIVSMTGVALSYFLLTRGPAVQSDSVLWLRIPANLGEQAPDDVFGLFDQRDTVGSVVTALRKAKVDDRVSAVVVVPPPAPGPWGTVQEIRDAVIDYRESGKPIAAFLEYGGAEDYYLASAADKVYLMPGSPLEIVGRAQYEVFFRNALDKVGAYPDVLAAGDYKTAANQYTETTMTPAHREMAESLNQDLYEQMIEGIAESRGLTGDEVRGLVDEGPFLPEDALAAGLVDGLAYADELKQREPFDGADWREISDGDYRQIGLQSVGLNRGERIALIYAVGAISSGTSSFDVLNGEVLGSDTLTSAIRSARQDDSVRAIVLRIDSPGGSAVASDVIWREVELVRESGKPIVASMSDLGASGGYYIAMGADAIVAQPATLTGSIGVVFGKFTIGGTYEKLGVGIEPVSEGRFAEIYSPVTRFSDAERAKVQQHVDAIYEQFVTKAAGGRQTTRDRLHEVAQGRVWTGRQALEHGLIDEVGGLARAIALAKEKAGIDPDDEVELVIYPRPRSFFELLDEGFPMARALGAVAASSPEAAVVGRATAPARLYRPGEPLAIMPGAFVP
jgi:protease-4